ncbi:hypothetical protein VTJ04DRAFT_8518 [Mycothermus thermophilus]|uniref:uncharacterized protein n=1 Tax=Humicola insolens TaxID=85995 RepID=UPI003743DDEC
MDGTVTSFVSMCRIVSLEPSSRGDGGLGILNLGSKQNQRYPSQAWLAWTAKKKKTLKTRRGNLQESKSLEQARRHTSRKWKVDDDSHNPRSTLNVAPQKPKSNREGRPAGNGDGRDRLAAAASTAAIPSSAVSGT